MRKPGFVAALKQELDSVLPEWQARVHRDGALTDAELVKLASNPSSDPALYHPDHPTIENVINAEEDIAGIDEFRGDNAIHEGEVAFVILAGGAGTRMGAPKVFARLPKVGLSLLAWKLMQAGNMPTWVMTSPGMTQEIQRHVSALGVSPGLRGIVFEQFEGYRLTPDNRLAQFAPGMPELYPLGHGDVGPALLESGVLDDNPKVKHVVICNVDNVLGCPHSGVIGRHILSGKKVTCEVVERRKGDKGGVLAWVENRLQVVEDFRLPDDFTDGAPFHNTNTTVISVDALREPIQWRWHRVSKHVDKRVVVQHERLLQQYTAEHETNFVLVPRDARYLPVKVPEDLDRAGDVLYDFEFKPR